MDKKLITVEYRGKTLELIEKPQSESYVYGLVRYCAEAQDDKGNDYRIEWDTTAEWDCARTLKELEEFIDDANNRKEEVPKEKLEHYIKLKCMMLPDPEDETQACDWAHPVKVEEI